MVFAIRKLRYAAPASLLLCLGGPSLAAPALSLHIVPADFQLLCNVIDPEFFTCADIDTVGNGTTYQFAFVLGTGLSDLTGIQFGVQYDDSVNVLAWMGCSGGLEIPTNTWPQSGEGLAISWSSCQEGFGADEMVLLGFLLIAPGGDGSLRITDHPGTHTGEIITCGSQTIYLRSPDDYGRVAIDPGSTADAYLPCNAPGDAGGSPEDGSFLSLTFAGDQKDCWLRWLFYGSSVVLHGTVTAVEPVAVSPISFPVRRRDLPAAMSPWWTDVDSTRIREDNLLRVSILVSWSVPALQTGMVDVFQYRSSMLNDGGMRLGSVSKPDFSAGMRVVIFCREAVLPSYGMSLVVPRDYSVIQLRDHEPDLPRFRNRVAALQAVVANTTLPTQSLGWLVGRVVEVREEIQERRGFTVARVVASDPLAGVPSVCDVYYPYRRTEPIGPVNCSILPMLSKGDLVRVAVCWDDRRQFYYSCEGGWSTIRIEGALQWRGYRRMSP